jgi:hypothetical protein
MAARAPSWPPLSHSCTRDSITLAPTLAIIANSVLLTLLTGVNMAMAILIPGSTVTDGHKLSQLACSLTCIRTRSSAANGDSCEYGFAE